MIQTLRYTDEKSDKFWNIETLDCEFMVNWGKAGTTGRYEIKSFDTKDSCEKQALKLIDSKKKKGYIAVEDFCKNGHYYFDTEEYGIHPLTSHPIFRNYFVDELYYDCCNEEAPFGSDEGNDAFYILQEMFRKKSKLDIAKFPQQFIEKEWGCTYFSPDGKQTEEELKMQATQEYSGLSGEQGMLQTDKVILATAFGQIKITGELDSTMQKLAFLSLSRMEKMYRLLWNWNENEPPHSITVMKNDLTRFVEIRN